MTPVLAWRKTTNQEFPSPKGDPEFQFGHFWAKNVSRLAQNFRSKVPEAKINFDHFWNFGQFMATLPTFAAFGHFATLGSFWPFLATLSCHRWPKWQTVAKKRPGYPRGPLAPGPNSPSGQIGGGSAQRRGTPFISNPVQRHRHIVGDGGPQRSAGLDVACACRTPAGSPSGSRTPPPPGGPGGQEVQFKAWKPSQRI